MEFHGISKNQQNWRAPSSMEFHGTARVREIGALWVPWNSMFFHGTAREMEIGALLFQGIAWNLLCRHLMEPLASSILWVLNLNRIPWNLSFQVLMKIISTFAQRINFRKIISTLYRFLSLFHQLISYYQYLHYTICISGVTHYVSKYHSKSLFNETYFDQKAPWNFLKSSMELFEQHLNNTCGSMEFHRT